MKKKVLPAGLEPAVQLRASVFETDLYTSSNMEPYTCHYNLVSFSICPLKNLQKPKLFSTA